MAEIYNDTLSASATTADLTVVATKLLGISSDGPILIESKHGAEWKTLGALNYEETGVFIPPTTTIRITDKSGASNAVEVNDDA